MAGLRHGCEPPLLAGLVLAKASKVGSLSICEITLAPAHVVEIDTVCEERLPSNSGLGWPL